MMTHTYDEIVLELKTISVIEQDNNWFNWFKIKETQFRLCLSWNSIHWYKSDRPDTMIYEQKEKLELISFEEVLENVSSAIQNELLFHLDIFSGNCD